MTGALDGLRVLDLTQAISGPFGTKHLADYGADVIKVERPGVGDVARRSPPFFHDDPHPEKSGLFLYLNTNKRGVTLNLKEAAGVTILREMVRHADLVVESFRPGTMERLGLGYDALSEINPALGMISVSNFGQTGPYRDYELTDLVNFALTGPMYQTGAPGREPLSFAEHTTLAFAGLAVANAVLGAAIASQTRGRGGHVDISLYDAFLATGERQPMSYFYSKDVPQRIGDVLRAQFLMAAYPCKDGYISVQGVGRGESWWPRVFKMIGKAELSQDPRFKDSISIMEHGDEFDALWYGWLLEHTREEIFDAAGEARYPIAPVYTAEDIYRDPHFRERDIFVEIDHPVIGPLRYPARPFKLHGAPCEIRRAAPLLGQHNDEVYRGMLGLSRMELAQLRSSGVS